MDYAKMALEEYNSEELTPHFGGKEGVPFWNVQSPQFIFVPSFLFPRIVGASKYLFTATDKNGKEHTFEADKPTAHLTPIWKDLPTGLVTLKVESLDMDGELNSSSGRPNYISGVRTFFKADPFPGRENLPKRACTYRECATKALRFAFNEPKIQSWLTDGKPPADFPLIFYTSKIVGGVIEAMLTYAKLDPENADRAIAIAKVGADYIMENSFGEGNALSGIPRTYMFGPTYEITNSVPDQRNGLVMTLYPASVGIRYFELAEVTGEKKYEDAAMKIADFYKKTVLPNGSWPLLVAPETGEIKSHKCCVSFTISSFLSMVAQKTGDESWNKLIEKYIGYITKRCHENFDWQGQFEDAPVSDNYSNLTHTDADSMVMYLADNFADNPEKLKEAEYLMRFIEDQFIVWGEFSPWISVATTKENSDISQWHSPAGLEQYNWYVPIDASTGKIMSAFLALYKANKNPLLLEKACALADSITRIQNYETGLIPTHWFSEERNKWMDKWFWINCHIDVANRMFEIAEFIGE